ncbi:glycogen debranching protein [Vibrio metschnikovii]|nr:glycogen debranching protein [Vibrio metschnikovii]
MFFNTNLNANPPNYNFSSTTPLLSAEELFKAMAIEENQSFPYLFSDNLEGYYNGQTGDQHLNSYYLYHNIKVHGSFVSIVNDKENNKQESTSAKLLPYGIEHHYSQSGSLDRLSVIQGNSLLCLSVETETPNFLAIIPDLLIKRSDYIVSNIGDILLYENIKNQQPKFIAIGSNQPINLHDLSKNRPDDSSPIKTSNNHFKFSSVKPCKQLKLYVYFGEEKQLTLEKIQQSVEMQADVKHQENIYNFICSNYFWTDDITYNKALLWSRLSSQNFINQQFGYGIWAGLPWFKDCWGRDTFIALPGTCLINGQFALSKAIINNFADMQITDSKDINFGRVPNRVTSLTQKIYNTTDGSPWMIRECMEYINYSGDFDFAVKIYPVIQRFINGVESNYLDDDGLITHRHPDTWMDAKIAGEIPWSPRGPKANDIQALWFESLQTAAVLAEMCNDIPSHERYISLAEQVKDSFNKKFWSATHKKLADRLMESDIADYSIRPNQLLTLTIPQQPLISQDIGQYIVKNSVDNLLFPWGICSLDQHDIDFHPYHDNRAEYHKDAAYHNGTIWGWNAGFTISALCKFKQQDFAYQLSKNLAQQILTQGHRGTMSENLDAYQEDPQALIMTGTYTQAWSVSEYARNAQQDYLGFTPRLSEQRIILRPALPSTWKQIKVRLPFGQDNALWFEMTSTENGCIYSVKPERAESSITFLLELDTSEKHLQITSSLEKELQVTIDHAQVICSPKDVCCIESAVVHYPLLDGLSFAQPDWQRSHQALEQYDYLLQKRMADNLPSAQD